VVQTSFIGDAVLTTPLLEHLAREGGDGVDVIATRVTAPLLKTHPAVRRVITYDKRHGGAAEFLRVARAARGDRQAYLAQGSARSAALALAAGCRERIGFDTSDGRWLYTARIRFRDDWHHARRLVSLATAAAGTLDDAVIRPSLYPTRDDASAVDAILDGRDTSARPLVALAPGSVWHTKRWPGFGALAALLADEADFVIVGGAGDSAAAAQVAQHAARARVTNATGRLSLLGSAELIGRAALLVCNDSAPQHLASAMGTPTITVFGPTVPDFGFGPLAPGSRTAGEESLSCRPCDRHGPRECPLGHWRCMRDLAPSSVAALARTLLDRDIRA